MPNLILTSVGWQERIRSKLGVDDAYLPDTAIEQPEIIDLAEANIIGMVPDYASLSGSKRIWLEAAVVCECAALLCTSMEARLPVRVQGPHMTHELAVDWDKKRETYLAERNEYINLILGDDWTGPYFTVTSGGTT